MLPLWIIDLQQDGERSDLLKKRIFPGNAEDADRKDFHLWKISRFEDRHREQNWFQAFVDKLVMEGDAFIRYLNEFHPVNDTCINICVIGDASEIFTLTIFSAIAAIIKKEKCLIIPDHVQQGINVLGMLYVPSDVNTLPFLKRQGVLRCLQELQVQRNVNRAGGYDKVLLFQDTQHRTEKFYTLLTHEQQADFVFQCLIHLYYVCDSMHPLLDGSNANDDFYFTMGAGSLYYDTAEQDDRDEVLVGNQLINRFRDKVESAHLERYSILDRDISPESLLQELEIDVSSRPNPRTIMRDCDPHPVNNFAHLNLKKRFYGEYLQHYVENYQKQAIRGVSHSSKEQLLTVNERMRKEEEDVKANIEVNIPSLIRCASEDVGALSLIEAKLGELSVEITHHKSDLKDEVERCIWHKIEDGLPGYFKDAFAKYHDAFRSDSETTVFHPKCDELKEEKTKELVGHLKNDATVLSRLVRAFLAGIVTVIAFMPILEIISPRLINIGNVSRYPFFYAFTLFLVPVCIEAIRFWRYHRKRKRLENEIVAYYLHDSYARLANRQYNKVNQLYDSVSNLIEKYKKRCERIRLDSKDFFNVRDKIELALPKTMFIQPVIGGECCGRKIFADEQQNHNVLLIDIDRVKIDKINRTQEYFLINKFSDKFSELFNGVVVDKKVFNPQTGEYIIRTKEEISSLEDSNYLDAKTRFQNEMKASIKSLFVKREDSTVGEKLDLYRRSPINAQGFDLFCRFNATNGEFTANDNEAFADIKSNSPRMRNAFEPFLPLNTTFQVIEDEENPLFKKYLFLTRWRTFNYITASRVLPEIELEDKDFLIDYGFGEGNMRPVASIVLYSILGNLSSEWYNLFDAESIERLQIRLHGRKRGKMTWKEIEKKLKEQRAQEAEKEAKEQVQKEQEQGILLEEVTIPYYYKILDTKVD